MTARSEFRQRLHEAKTTAMGWLAPKLFTRKTTGVDGAAKKLVMRGGGADLPLDPDLEHPAEWDRPVA